MGVLWVYKQGGRTVEFEFSCKEVLEAIAKMQKRLDREYARAEEQERLNP